MRMFEYFRVGRASREVTLSSMARADSGLLLYLR